MAADKDYGQLFCEAVDTLVKKRLEDISFDTTKVCTITSNNEAKNGKYRVKVLDGLSEFEAYTSDTELKIGQAVYVQIPSGDMNEQKFIIGKKTDDSDYPMSYTPPFASFINITGNLISNTEGVNGQLIATNIETEKEKNKEYKDAITIWTYNIENTPLNISSDIGEPLSQYGLLGIQAQFRSWLKELQAEQGSYGLKLRVEAEEEDIADIVNLDEEEQEKYYTYIKATKYDAEEKYYIKNEEQYEQVTEPITAEQFADGDYYFKERKVSYYDFELDCSEMIGDPYNFSSYYQQEKLFDISHIYQIRKMELQFYQKRDFFDRFGQPLKILDEPNLFVKDVIVSFGYDISEFDSDKVQIFSLDSPKYIPTNNPVDEANHKKLQLRWIHKDKNGKIAIVSENNNLDYKITWYKYRLGIYSHTPMSGADWMPMSVQFSDVRLGHIAYDGEIYADSDAYDSKGIIQKYNILDEEWKQYNQSAELGLTRYPSENMTWLIPDITLPTESIKVVVSYLEDPNNENSRKYITSNVLTFENRKETVSKPTVDAVTALTIHCEDETDGNYLIYNLANELLDSGQSKTERTFTAYFRNAPLQNADYIEWIIPKTNSMLVMDEFYKAPNFSPEVQKRNEFKGKENNKDKNDPDFYHIYRFGDVNNKYDISHANTQRYKIRSSYDPGRTNNTVQCKVMKDKITYTAVLDLAFGQAGTSGSDHTLRIKYQDPNTTAIVAPPEGTDATVAEYVFEAELTNFSGEKIDLTTLKSPYDLEWSLITTANNEIPEGQTKLTEADTKGLVLYTEKNENDELNLSETSNTVTCRTKTGLDINQIYILQAKLKWRSSKKEDEEIEEDEEVEEILTSYFPIALKKEIDKKPEKNEEDQPDYEKEETVIGYDKDGNEIKLLKSVYYDYIDIKGPDRIVYQADGGLPTMTRDSYALRKNKYKETDTNVQELAEIVERDEDGNVIKEIIWRQIETIEETGITWEILKPNYEAIVDKSSSEAINLLKLYPTIDSKNYLAPLPFYIEDSPLCAVQAKSGQEVLWTQPLLIIMNKYPNGAVNRWDGNGLVLNEEEGTIIGSAMAAGKKNSDDNTFSGVMLGAWEGKAKQYGGVANELTELTGVYGFHHGQISYAFKEDGTAFIGKSGRGRIHFDGNDSKIYSASYDYKTYVGPNGEKYTSPVGMMIDLGGVSGKPYIDLRADGSSILLKAEQGKSKIVFTNDNKDSIIINSDSSNKYPLEIGDYFDVAWDGSLYATNGYFTGDINATNIYGSTIIGTNISGSCLNGTHIQGTTIKGQAMDGGSIYGGSVSGTKIYAIDLFAGSQTTYVYEVKVNMQTKDRNGNITNSWKSLGTVQSTSNLVSPDSTKIQYNLLPGNNGTIKGTTYARLGYKSGATIIDDEVVPTETVGIFSTSTDATKPLSLAFHSDNDIGIAATKGLYLRGKGNVQLKGGEIWFVGDLAKAENQHNIYARFA